MHARYDVPPITPPPTITTLFDNRASKLTSFVVAGAPRDPTRGRSFTCARRTAERLNQFAHPAGILAKFPNCLTCHYHPHDLNNFADDSAVDTFQALYANVSTSRWKDSLDPTPGIPATLSRPILTDLLRGELGLVVLVQNGEALLLKLAAQGQLLGLGAGTQRGQTVHELFGLELGIGLRVHLGDQALGVELGRLGRLILWAQVNLAILEGLWVQSDRWDQLGQLSLPMSP